MYNFTEALVSTVLCQDPVTGQITIRAEKHGDGSITSARLESYQVWSTAQSQDIKMRGYLEVGTHTVCTNCTGIYTV